MAQNGPQVAEGGYTRILKRSTDMEDSTNIPNEEQTGRLQQTAVSRCAFMVLRGKDAGNVFWTSGGDYRTDWYDLLGEFDTAEEAQAHWRFHYYNPQPRHIG